MDTPGDFDVDEFLTEIAEISVGAAILGLRRLNIERRRLVDEHPSLEPSVNAVLDKIDELCQPVSDVFGAAIAGIGDAIDGERGKRVSEAGQMVAELGPELLRLSGLTKHD